MGYVLLWLEGLAVGWLFQAALLAGRGGSRARRLAAAALPVLPALLGAAAGAFVLWQRASPRWLLAASIAWIAVYVAGAVRIARRAHAADAGGTPGLAPSRGVLLGALAGALALNLATAGYLDARTRAVAAGHEAATAARLGTLVPAAPAPGENARPLYEQADRALGSTQGELSWLSRMATPGFEPPPGAARELLAARRSALTLVRRAADRPAFHAPLLAPDGSLRLPRTGYGGLAGLLAVAARSAADDGRVDEALADLARLDAMARHLAAVPAYLYAALSGHVEQVGTAAWAHVLNAAPVAELAARIDLPVEPRDARTRDVFLRAGTVEDLVRTARLAGSVAGNRPWSIRGGSPAVIDEYLLPPIYRLLGAPSDLASNGDMLAAFEEIRAAATLREAREVSARVQARLREDVRKGILTSLVMVLAEPPARPYQAQAWAALRAVAIAALAHRAVRGRCPRTLSDLVPDFLATAVRDPFDGEPLRLAVADGRCVAYSVGPDLADAHASGAGTAGDDLEIVLEPR